MSYQNGDAVEVYSVKQDTWVAAKYLEEVDGKHRVYIGGQVRRTTTDRIRKPADTTTPGIDGYWKVYYGSLGCLHILVEGTQVQFADSDDDELELTDGEWEINASEKWTLLGTSPPRWKVDDDDDDVIEWEPSTREVFEKQLAVAADEPRIQRQHAEAEAAGKDHLLRDTYGRPHKWDLEAVARARDPAGHNIGGYWAYRRPGESRRDTALRVEGAAQWEDDAELNGFKYTPERDGTPGHWTDDVTRVEAVYEDRFIISDTQQGIHDVRGLTQGEYEELLAAVPTVVLPPGWEEGLRVYSTVVNADIPLRDGTRGGGPGRHGGVSHLVTRLHRPPG